MNLERWSATDLARIAAITGGKLAFVFPDGQQILIDPLAEVAVPAQVPKVGDE